MGNKYQHSISKIKPPLLQTNTQTYAYTHTHPHIQTHTYTHPLKHKHIFFSSVSSKLSIPVTSSTAFGPGIIKTYTMLHTAVVIEAALGDSTHRHVVRDGWDVERWRGSALT
jgi:hypothetical protein